MIMHRPTGKTPAVVKEKSPGLAASSSGAPPATVTYKLQPKPRRAPPSMELVTTARDPRCDRCSPVSARHSNVSVEDSTEVTSVGGAATSLSSRAVAIGTVFCLSDILTPGIACCCSNRLAATSDSPSRCKSSSRTRARSWTACTPSLSRAVMYGTGNSARQSLGVLNLRSACALLTRETRSTQSIISTAREQFPKLQQQRLARSVASTGVLYVGQILTCHLPLEHLVGHICHLHQATHGPICFRLQNPAAYYIEYDGARARSFQYYLYIYVFSCFS